MTNSAATPALNDWCAARAQALNDVRALIIAALRVDRAPDELDPDTALFGSGLGLDSIDAVELAVALETTFGISLADNPFARAELRTVNGLVDLVMRERTGSAMYSGAAANGN